jgi:hypothetical protein
MMVKFLLGTQAASAPAADDINTSVMNYEENAHCIY